MEKYTDSDGNGGKLQTDLKPHQTSASNFFYNSLKTYNSGLCSDQMGLGKTLLALSIACKIKNGIGNILVILPSAPKREWLQQIETHLVKSTVCVSNFEGKQSQREAILTHDIIYASKKNQLLITLCSYGIMTTSIDFLNTKTWNLIIFDECQYLKNEKTQISKAGMQIKSSCPRFGLSGTPCANSALKDLTGICKILYPTRILLHNPETFENEPVFEKTHLGRNIDQIQELSLPMKRIKQIPLEFETKEEVHAYDSAIKKLQNAYYHMQSAQSGTDREQRRKIYEGALQQTEGAATHPDLTHVRLGKIEIENARISTKEKSVFNILNHYMERDRLKKRDTPIIINSRSTTVLAILHTHLKRQFPTINLFCYNGRLNPSQRIAVLNQWEACPNGILLLSTKAGSTGMTLIHAHVMISIDALSDPNWSILDQVEARIYRIGQKHKVSLYRLSMTGTVDEVIGGEIHQFKREASKTILYQTTKQKSKTTKDIPSIYGKATNNWIKYIETLKEKKDIRLPQQYLQHDATPLKRHNIIEKRKMQRHHPYQSKSSQKSSQTNVLRRPQFAEKDGKIIIVN